MVLDKLLYYNEVSSLQIVCKRPKFIMNVDILIVLKNINSILVVENIWVDLP